MPEIGGFPRGLDFAIPALPTWVDNLSLAPSTAETYIVPAGVNRLLLSASTAVYVRIGGTAAVPSSDVTDGTSSFLLGTGATFAVEPGEELSFISGGSSQLTIGCYRTRL